MAKPDRAARVAGRIKLLCNIERGCDACAGIREAIARAIRREVKRAVEEEREACAHVADLTRDWCGGSTGNAEGTGRAIAAAIRARK